MNKEKRKFLRRKTGLFFLKLFVILSTKLSLKLNYFLGKIFGSIAYLIVFKHRKIALENLAIAFPALSLKNRKKIARDFFIFMSCGSFELLYFLKNQRFLENIEILGKENLDNALKDGRGVIFLTAHFGNFPLLSLKLAKAGYKVNFVTRPMRDKQVGDYLYNLREEAGVKTIFSYPRKECVSKIIKALRNNEIVIIQMDQNFGTGGVWVKFFGELAATPVGAITLALRTKSTIIPGYIYRKGIGRHIIKIIEPQSLILTENKDQTVLLNAINFTRIIEAWIKEFPCQWGWIHRRWKSRPSEKIKNLKFKVEE